MVVFSAILPSAVALVQALASPFSTISQMVDSTTITVEYYRPSARGRVMTIPRRPPGPQG